MKIFQAKISLRRRSRGFHVITQDVLSAIPQISLINMGFCQVFIQHTSASLSINESADPSVLDDFEMFFSKLVPERDPDYVHDQEGDDDMPAHLKASLLGCSVMIPVSNGKLALGTWQGIYLCEHRDHARPRSLVVSVWGQE